MKPPVLVVEYDSSIRRMLVEVLTLEDYTVQTAEHGGLGLDIMCASTERLLVLLGLNMPSVDGRDVLEAVAADEALAARHSIVMMAALQCASTGRVAELREQLGVPLLRVPFRVQELLDTIEEASARLAQH